MTSTLQLANGSFKIHTSLSLNEGKITSLLATKHKSVFHGDNVKQYCILRASIYGLSIKIFIKLIYLFLPKITYSLLCKIEKWLSILRLNTFFQILACTLYFPFDLL